MYINVPTLIKILLMNYLPQYIVSVVLSKRFKQPQKRNRIVHVIPFLVIPSVLIDQNYVAIVLILITLKSSTETDISISLEYIVSA